MGFYRDFMGFHGILYGLMNGEQNNWLGLCNNSGYNTNNSGYIWLYD